MRAQVVTLCSILASAWHIPLRPGTLGKDRRDNAPRPLPLTDVHRGAVKCPSPSDGAKTEQQPSEGTETDASAEGYDLWWSCDPTEVAAPLHLDVHGDLPAWLKGSIVRLGPGQFQVGRQQLKHQLDGLAKLTKYTIAKEGVTFQTRMLRSHLFNRTKLAAPSSSRRWAPQWTEPALITMLASQPTYTPCQRVRALFEDSATDNTNIFVCRTGNTFHACSDSSIPSNAFDLDTLESRGHTRVELEAPRRMPEQTMTGAHRLHVINGSDTIGWTGSIDLDPILVLPAATVISVYRDAPVQPTDDEANVETPLTARRRYIGQVRIPLAGNGLPMIHSFQVTRRYVILVLCSLRVEPHLIGSKLFVLQEPFAGVQTLGWRGHQNTTVYVMDIESTDPTTGPLRTFSIDPMFLNHHINAWEDEASREVIMDVIAYRDGSFLSNPRGFGNLEVMRSSKERAILKTLAPTVRRYTLELQQQIFEPRSLSPNASGAHEPDEPLWASWVPYELSPDKRLPTPAEEWPRTQLESPPTADVLHMEMPRFNERKHGLPYRYVWGIGSPDSSPTHVSGIVKVDLGDPSTCSAPGADSHLPIDAPCLSWYRASHYPSEPIFVPRVGATSEDDGVVLSAMLDGKRGKSYLLVLNATTMQTMATAYSPVVMPADFHGEWFPHEEVAM
jgi:carotenoid cleavage dioxygenase-like enzyme